MSAATTTPTADLVVANNIPAGRLLELPAELVHEIERTALSAIARGETPIESRADFDVANDLVARLLALDKQVEARRVAAKRPVDDLAKAIQAACVPWQALAKDGVQALGARVKAYERAETERVERERREAEAAAEAERARLEAEVRAKHDAEVDDAFPGDEPFTAPAPVHVPVRYIPPAPKSVLRGKTTKAVRVVDLNAVPLFLEINGQRTYLWNLDEQVIKRLDALGVKVPGIEVEAVEGVAGKGGR